jgi:hypothetical protein
MPKEEKFESDKQRKWYNATDQDFWDEKKFCGIPEKERDPNHPQPIPAMADEPEPKRPEDIDRRRPQPPMAKWWNTVKGAGPITTTAPGVKPGLINEAYGKGQQPPEEEEEYPIIPEEPDFWRD